MSEKDIERIKKGLAGEFKKQFTNRESADWIIRNRADILSDHLADVRQQSVK